MTSLLFVDFWKGKYGRFLAQVRSFHYEMERFDQTKIISLRGDVLFRLTLTAEGYNEKKINVQSGALEGDLCVIVITKQTTNHLLNSKPSFLKNLLNFPSVLLYSAYLVRDELNKVDLLSNRITHVYRSGVNIYDKHLIKSLYAHYGKQ